MSISVATLGISTWELVDRLERLHGEVTVVRRCMDLSELLACSHTGMADVALVAEGAEELTGSLLEQLGGNGVRVLVVEGHDSSRLSRLGVGSVAVAASGEDIAQRIRLALRGPAGGHAGNGPAAQASGATSAAAGEDDDSTAPDDAAARHEEGATARTPARDVVAGAPDPRLAPAEPGAADGSRSHGSRAEGSAGQGRSGDKGSAGGGTAGTGTVGGGRDKRGKAAGRAGGGSSVAEGRRAPGKGARGKGRGRAAGPAVGSDDARGSGSARGESPSPAQPTKGAGTGTSADRETNELGGESGESAWRPDAHAASAAPGSAPDGSGARGLVTVWGPAGSPGRTVTAVNLAAEAAVLGVRVLLVDADTYAASVAASLGMLDEAAGLAQACRLADQGRMDEAGLRRCVTAVSVAGASMDVLTGITRHDRWPEIRGSALESVLERARQDYELVVVDVSSCLEADEEISTDFLAPRRNAAALGAVAAADTVIALGAADALGVPRLVKALPDLWEAAPSARLVVVVNKLRAAAAGRSAGEAVREAWDRFSPGNPVAHTLPWDPAACDDALLAGAVLAETAPRSALRAELTALVRVLEHPEEDSGAAQTTVRGTRLGRQMGAWLRRG